MSLLPTEGMPSGVLVYLNQETGEWVMSVNRFIKKMVTEEHYVELIGQAKEFLREARAAGHDVVDPDDEDAIRERLPGIGDEIGGLESVNRVLEGGLEEAADILPKLWGWIVGIDEEPWEPDQS